MELNDFLNDNTSEIVELGMIEYLDDAFSDLFGLDFRFADCNGMILASTTDDIETQSEYLIEYNKITALNRHLIIHKQNDICIFLIGIFTNDHLNGIVECILVSDKTKINLSTYKSKDVIADELFMSIYKSVDLFLRLYNNDKEIKVLKTKVRHTESSVDVLRKEHLDIQSINIKQREELEKNNEELNLNKKKLEDYGRNLEKKVIERTRELQISKEKAEEANKLKSQLLANMSHEMRTPLNSVIGFTELVLEDNPDKNHREYLEKVSGNGNLLLSLINDILDLSKIQANQMKLETIPASLDKVFTDTEANGKSLIIQKDKSIELKKNLHPSISNNIICDPVRLQQIMNNLMSNAVKFTDSGFVEYGVSLNDKKMLQFYFKDTGIGISKENIDNIFDTFQQADMSTTRKYGGTGLGLTITKQIIKLMGGDIWIESVIGEGTTFYFTIPYTPYAKTLVSDSDAPKDSLEELPFNILVAEDSIDNQLLAERILTKKGHSVIIANNGQEALDVYLKKHDEIDIILMDMQMPVLGGLEATAKIREAEKKDSMSKIPIIALTANAMKGVKEECLQAGCDGYSTKPLKKKELFPAINRLVSQSEKNPLNTPFENHLLTPKIKVMIVDDSKNNRMLLDAILSKNSYETVIAENGEEALSLYRRYHNTIDCILMDLEMPVMSGLEATKRIRKFEREMKIDGVLIAALTAGSSDSDQERCLSEGSNVYMTKPVNKKVLLSFFEEHFHNKY